jgi:valyl-tRNA synthetase
MSKTKGNVVDPLEIIERFGTDATRFTLAAMAAPGTDIAFNQSRTEGYRNFANKIWNAARLLFLNLDRVAPGLRPGRGAVRAGHPLAQPGSEIQSPTGIAGFVPGTLEDQWILSRFSRVTEAVNDALATYRFHEAANCIYDFFWGDFCDWYLELIKPRLASNLGEEAHQACANLVNLFEAALRLLHPVMPFITEEIWQAIYEGAPPLKSIALAAFPQPDRSQINPPAETQMAILQDLIVSIRNLRAELKVEMKARVAVEVFAHDPETGVTITQNAEAVRRLAHVESMTWVEESKARQAPSRSTTRFDVHVVYAKKIDSVAECERLRKELEKIEKEIANGQRQLANQEFRAKAPAQVVEGVRKRAQELQILQATAKSKLQELGC